MKIIYLFLVSIFTFGVLDFIWLSKIMSSAYRKFLAPIGRFGADGDFSPHIPSALVVYLLITLGFIIFIFPVVMKLPLNGAFIYGAIFGIIVYGIYEFTNYAGLKDWPWNLVIIDTLWGGVLFGLSSIIIPWIVRMFNIF